MSTAHMMSAKPGGSPRKIGGRVSAARLSEEFCWVWSYPRNVRVLPCDGRTTRVAAHSHAEETAAACGMG